MVAPPVHCGQKRRQLDKSRLYSLLHHRGRHLHLTLQRPALAACAGVATFTFTFTFYFLLFFQSHPAEACSSLCRCRHRWPWKMRRQPQRRPLTPPSSCDLTLPSWQPCFNWPISNIRGNSTGHRQWLLSDLRPLGLDQPRNHCPYNSSIWVIYSFVYNLIYQLTNISANQQWVMFIASEILWGMRLCSGASSNAQWAWHRMSTIHFFCIVSIVVSFIAFIRPLLWLQLICCHLLLELQQEL